MSNRYYTSNGDSYTESSIRNKLSEAYSIDVHEAPYLCQCCNKVPWVHHDHTIAKARCKVLHKTELIWDPDNWSYSCQKCHNEWESYKSGEFVKHENLLDRMVFLQKHDEEGYIKRSFYIEE